MAESKESPFLYYVCIHQSSNTPCAQCHPGQAKVDDDWFKDYVSPGAPGLSDEIL